jgi:FecR protein
MSKRTVVLAALTVISAGCFAANIDRATITEVVNNVTVIEPSTKRTSAAKVRGEFATPNVLRTGAASRAELTAADQTVTRVGQNTLFSFQPNSREIDLQRGSILFQSPSGNGGGTIRTPAASAAVLGTTLIVVTTRNGGFKVLLMEGKGRMKAADGTVRRLGAGQMVYALPGGRLSGVFEFRLSQQVAAAQLVKGFRKPLASAGKIQAAIEKQEKEIEEGGAVATNLLATGTPGLAIRVDVARDAIVAGDDDAAGDSPVILASSSDAVISEPTLDSARIFQPDGMSSEVPLNLSFFDHFGVPHGPDAPAQRPALFLANNITFDTPQVDFGPFADRDLFQFLAINDISFAQSVNLGSFGGREVQLFAGGGFDAAPGTIVRTDTNRLAFISLGSSYPLTGSAPRGIEDVGFAVPFALSDFAAVNTGGALEFVGGDFNFAGVQLGARDALVLASARDIVIRRAPDGAVLSAAPSPFRNGASEVGSRFSTFTSRDLIAIGAARDADIRRTEFRSPSTRIEAGRRLDLTEVQFNDGTPLPPPNGSPAGNFGVRSVHLTGKNLVDLRLVNFFANDVLVQSQTIRLENVNFRRESRVILESSVGRLAANANSGAPVVPGFVNFVRGVRYGGQDPIQGSAVRQNGPGSTPSGPGIFIRPLGNRAAPGSP